MFIILLVCIGLIVWAFNLSWKRDSVWVRIGNTFFWCLVGFYCRYSINRSCNVAVL